MKSNRKLQILLNSFLVICVISAMSQLTPLQDSAASKGILACADKKTGALRVAYKKCTSKENPIVWNQLGTRGETGAQGLKGETGAQGLKGETGAQGLKGETGAISVGVAGPITNSGTATDPQLGFDQEVQNATNDSRYARKNRIRAAIMSSRFSSSSNKPFPPISMTEADIPKMTSASASAVPTPKKVSLFDPNIRFVSPGSTFETSNNRFKTPLATTLEFVLIGDTVELHWVAAGLTGSDALWVWVDGKPTTHTPISTDFLTALGSQVFTKLVFGDASPRTVTIHFSSINSIYGLNLPINQSLSTPMPKLKGLLIGDSFFAGVGSPRITAFESSGYQMCRILDIECAVYAEGGTGYVSSGQFTTRFGSNARTTYASSYNPDFIVISGSVNDDGRAEIGAAVASTLSAFANACPNVPIIVFGPQPNNATSTLSMNRGSNNTAVIANSLPNPDVIAVYDQIGNGRSVVPAWNNSTTYSTEALVSYIGSIWRWDRFTPASNVAPGGTTSNGWSLVSYSLTGTGSIGSPAGDGTRDLYLLADSVHLSKDGATAVAVRMASEIKSALMTFALS